MTGVPLTKICGLTRREDVLAAEQAGADYVGVVLSAGFGRSVPLTTATDLVRDVAVSRVAVLVDETVEASLEAGRAIDAAVLQLHGHESVASVHALKRAGGFQLWKAVRARSSRDISDAVALYGDFVDAFLVEGWREGTVGGAGLQLEVAGPDVRRAIGPRTTFVLAGGLAPETVAGAVARFRPDVVDVSSGVERKVGVKDHDLLSAFVRQARTIAVPEPIAADDRRPS